MHKCLSDSEIICLLLLQPGLPLDKLDSWSIQLCSEKRITLFLLTWNQKYSIIQRKKGYDVDGVFILFIGEINPELSGIIEIKNEYDQGLNPSMIFMLSDNRGDR